MKLLKHFPLIVSVTATIVMAGIAHSSTSSAAMQGTGTIKGHVRLSGKNPGNTVIFLFGFFTANFFSSR